MLLQIRMHTCGRRFSVTRARAGLSLAFPWKVPRFVQMTTPQRTSTAASSRQEKSCWAEEWEFLCPAATWSQCCRNIHRGMNRKNLQGSSSWSGDDSCGKGWETKKRQLPFRSRSCEPHESSIEGMLI